MSKSSLPPVYAATYDHIGIILWGLEKFRRVLAQELDWLERHPNYRMGWDHEAYSYDYLAQEAPEVLEELRQALQRYTGRLGIGACTYGQPLAAFVNEESNIRQLTTALETCAALLGCTPSIYLMSEHAFHAQMPQLLVGCGFNGAVLRTHFMMYGHNPEYEAAVGHWVGLDGSRITALPTYPGQLSPPLLVSRVPGLTSTRDNRILTDAPSPESRETLTDFRRIFGKRIRPLVATRADDVRNHEALLDLHAGDPGVRWALLEEIFDLLPQPRAVFATQPDDFKLRMPWGYCGSWIWQGCRAAEVRVLIAERLAAIAHALGGPACETELEQAWKALLVAQHHDIQICGLEEDARQFLRTSQANAETVIAQAWAVVEEAHTPTLAPLIFNPLPWERTELVEIDGISEVVTVPGLGFVCLPEPFEPNESPFEWQEDVETEHLRAPVRMRSDDLGRPYIFQRANQLRTPFYDVFLGEHGGIRLLVERASGQVILAPPKVSGQLAGMVNGVEVEAVGAFQPITLHANVARLVEEGLIGDIPYKAEWTFYADNQRIDWRAEVHYNRQWIGRPKHPQPASDYVFDDRDLSEQVVPAFYEHEHKLRLRCYPRLGPHVTGVRDLPFHVAETPDPYLHCNYWAAVSDGQVGLAYFNRGQMGCLRESDQAFSNVLAFSLPYVWGTRVLEGTYTYELGLLPFLGPWQAANLHQQALEYNFPLLVRPMVSPASHSSSQAQGFESWSPYRAQSQPGAILSALYTRNGQTYCRFYEINGCPAEIEFEWFGQPVQLIAADLRGNLQGELGTKAQLLPWQIQTVAINRGIDGLDSDNKVYQGQK